MVKSVDQECFALKVPAQAAKKSWRIDRVSNSRALRRAERRPQSGAPPAAPKKLRIASGDSAHSYLVDKVLGAAQDGDCFSGSRCCSARRGWRRATSR